MTLSGWSQFAGFLQRRGLVIVLLAVLLKQVVFVIIVPPWLVPDEAAHLQYARTLLLEKKIPELRGRLVAYDVAMRDFFRRQDIRQIGHEERKQYELEKYWADHPTERDSGARYNPAGAYSPIYYAAVGWPLLLLEKAPISVQLFTIRFVSSLLLLVVVWMGWRIVTKLGGSSGQAATVALLVGFHPGLSLNFAGVNNDALLIAGGAILLHQLVTWFKHPPNWSTVFWVGIGCGLVTLIKPVGAGLIIIAAVLALVVHHWRLGGWTKAIATGALGFSLGSLWMVRELVLGQNSFLLDPELWKIQSRLLPSISFGSIVHGDLTYWWPASFFTYWGEYFAKQKIPTILPLGYFFTLLLIVLMSLGGWILAQRQRTITAIERRLGLLSFSIVLVHELWLWAVHLQTTLRYRDFQFLYHGRYRYVVAPFFLLLVMIGLEKLFPAKAVVVLRLIVVSLMIGACLFVGWAAIHV